LHERLKEKMLACLAGRDAVNWIEVLVATIGGGVGGGVGALVAKAIRVEPIGLRTKVASPRQLLPALLGVACALVSEKTLGPAATEAWADARARTPSQKFERAVARNVSSNAEVLAWAKTMQARGLSAEQTSTEGRKVGAQGIARLSDAELLAWAGIRGRGMRLVDPHTCATFARGTAGGAELTNLLDALGESDAQELASIAGHAMLAGIRQVPAARPQTTEDDVSAIFEAVSTIAGEEAVTAVRRIFADGANDDEVCSGTRILSDVLPRTNALTQSRLAMMLAGL